MAHFPPRTSLHLILACALAAAGCAPSAESAAAPAAPGDWREFEGSWNAAGSRRTIALGPERKSSIVELRGTMLIQGASRPGLGFRSDAIGLVDSATGFVGRSVWTDERGDQVFSELQGQGTAAQNRISGTIVGGTGRYAGAEGSFAFSWQWVMEAEDGALQGRAVGLKGRVRSGAQAGGAPR